MLCSGLTPCIVFVGGSGGKKILQLLDDRLSAAAVLYSQGVNGPGMAEGGPRPATGWFLLLYKCGQVSQLTLRGVSFLRSYCRLHCCLELSTSLLSQAG